MRADAGDEHAHINWFRDVIVGAAFQRALHRVAAIQRRHHDDRQAFGVELGAQSDQRFESRALRHHPIEQHQLDLFGDDHLFNVQGGFTDNNFVTTTLKTARQNVPVVRLVIHHKNAAAAGRVFGPEILFRRGHWVTKSPYIMTR
jgi:hypothetical protein